MVGLHDATKEESMTAPEPTGLNSKRSNFIGKSQARVEDEALLRGLGRYGGDLATPPGTLHAAVLRSPHAHARHTWSTTPKL